MELIELKTNGIPSVTITQLAQSKPEYWLEQFWLNTSKILQKPPKLDCMHSEREGSRRMLMYSLSARFTLFHCAGPLGHVYAVSACYNIFNDII